MSEELVLLRAIEKLNNKFVDGCEMHEPFFNNIQLLIYLYRCAIFYNFLINTLNRMENITNLGFSSIRTNAKILRLYDIFSTVYLIKEKKRSYYFS